MREAPSSALVVVALSHRASPLRPGFDSKVIADVRKKHEVAWDDSCNFRKGRLRKQPETCAGPRRAGPRRRPSLRGASWQPSRPCCAPPSRPAGRSSTCVAIDQVWPNGSVIEPNRSPQNMSWTSIVTVAPASTACWTTASTSSTYMKMLPLVPPELLRRARARLRKRIRQHHVRVADLELGVPDLAVGAVHAHRLLGAERLLVVLDRRSGVVDREVRRDRVVSVGNGLGHVSLSSLVRTALDPTPVPMNFGAWARLRNRTETGRT